MFVVGVNFRLGLIIVFPSFQVQVEIFVIMIVFMHITLINFQIV
jgi:hypothetical protein